MSAPAADFRARVRAQIAANPAPTRSAGTRRSIILHTGAALVMLAFFELAGGLSHSSGRPLALTLAVAGSASLVAALTTWIARPKMGSMLGRSRLTYLAIAIGTPALLFGAMVVWSGMYEEPCARIGFRCVMLTVGMGLALGSAMFAVRRGRVVHHVRANGAAIGAIAGAWASVLVDLWCPLTNAPHALVGHVVPIVALASIGALVAKRVLPLRTRT
ncbi:hypothetical protein BH09MYX1_BH09MYX1_31070 [soil metagenome]